MYIYSSNTINQQIITTKIKIQQCQKGEHKAHVAKCNSENGEV